jgi:hypothetical protein
MAKDIPKELVAAVIHQRNLLPKLIEAASSGLEVAPVASYLIDSLMNPSIRFIPLDDPQYIMGVAGLMAYGFITQEDADAVNSLYIEEQKPQFVRWLSEAEPTTLSGIVRRYGCVSTGGNEHGMWFKLPVDSDHTAVAIAVLEGV